MSSTAAAAAVAAAVQKEPVVPLDVDDKKKAPSVKLVTCDNKEFCVLVSVAKQSKLIDTVLDSDKTCDQIDMPNIPGAVFERILEYLLIHQTVVARHIEEPLKSTSLRDLVDDRDWAFLEKMDHIAAMQVMLAANYLDVPPLVRLIQARFASIMKGKSATQIREEFELKDDITPEEEQSIRADYKELLT